MNNASVYISGILGTVGKSLVVMLKQAGFEVGGFDPAVKLVEGHHPPLEFPVYVPAQMAETFSFQTAEKPMVLVIFSNDPATAVEQAELAAANGLRIVIGTTGFSSEQTERLKALAGEVPIIVSSNFSLAVNLMIALAQKMRALLPVEYVGDVFERHHDRKKDAPSGTAKTLAKAAGINLADGRVLSVRAGNIVGDHKLTFVGPFDELVIEHHAQDRRLFCAGAVTAVKWILERKEPGWYTMDQVFGL